MDTVLENFYINIPQSDVSYLMELAKKMGWKVEKRERIINRYFDSRNDETMLSEDDIMKEVEAVRYGK
jgi:hypothetical protein